MCTEEEPEAMKQTLLAIFFVLGPVAAHAQVLWGGTEYGMTVDQVKAAVPKAVPPHMASHIKDAKEQLQLEEIELVNKRFVASFYFADGKLVQVTLRLDSDRTPTGAALTFNSLTEALRAKYGQELAQDNKAGDRSALRLKNTTWLSGRTNITMTMLNIPGMDPVLNINYQVRLAKDADKL